MKKSLWLVILISWSVHCLQAQKHFTREGKISFTSEAPLEKIEAKNNSAVSIIDLESGNLEFAVLIKAFQFEKALMQEHFNENYMESSTFPKATFKGQIIDYQAFSLEENAEYPVIVKGQMTIHGVTKELETNGTLIVKDGKLSAQATFTLQVADFDIKIPKIVREKIAKVVDVLVDLNYQLYKS